MQKNKTMPKSLMQSYINDVATEELDLLKLASYLALKSNGLFEVSLIKKQKNWF